MCQLPSSVPQCIKMPANAHCAAAFAHGLAMVSKACWWSQRTHRRLAFYHFRIMWKRSPRTNWLMPLTFDEMIEHVKHTHCSLAADNLYVRPWHDSMCTSAIRKNCLNGQTTRVKRNGIDESIWGLNSDSVWFCSSFTLLTIQSTCDSDHHCVLYNVLIGQDHRIIFSYKTEHCSRCSRSSTII